MHFPNTFAEAHVPLQDVALDDPGVQALRHLKLVDYMVAAGVCREDVPAITEIANQEGVREFCPRDAKERFVSERSMEKWLGKNGGRGMFLLKNIGTQAIEGFGWVGKEKCEELPRCETTFAIRLHERAAGARKGVGTAFTTAIVSGAMALHKARGIGLETWASNAGAVNAYINAGATVVKARSIDKDGKLITRPTLDENFASMNGERPDTRLFMEFERTF